METASSNGCYDRDPLLVNYLNLQGARQDERPLRVRASYPDLTSAEPDPLTHSLPISHTVFLPGAQQRNQKRGYDQGYLRFHHPHYIIQSHHMFYLERDPNLKLELQLN